MRHVGISGTVVPQRSGNAFFEICHKKSAWGMAQQCYCISNPNIKVYDVAQKVGFGHDSQYFCDVFKKYTSLTPKKFQRRT